MYGWDDDDVHLGESLRGMQETEIGNVEIGNVEIGAAQRQLRQLRGGLGQLAANRFNRHAPLQRPVRPAYKDSTQIGIKCQGTFTPSTWTGSSTLPQVTGRTRVYESFKPTKAIVTENILVTFETASLGAVTRAANVSDASDLILVSAFAGAKNCFPTAPDQDTGISGAAFANNSLGNGISWPTINGGIDMVVQFGVEQSVIYQITPPTGYTSDDITSIVVTVRFNLLGPSLRP